MTQVLKLQDAELPLAVAEAKASMLSVLQCPHSAVSIALCEALRRP